MIHIRVLQAQNIPVYNNQHRKTLISCFSISSYRYFYGSFKSKEKTTEPSWNAEFDADLFRLIELNFSLYGTRFMSKNVFLGNVNIDFIDFLSKPPGNQILSGPEISIRFEFPITTFTPSNAFLSLAFSFTPTIYRPIEFNPSFYTNYFIHLWPTFNPPLQNQESPVEIELLQAFHFEEEKSDIQYGIFYNLNKDTPFESIGKSSTPRYFIGPTGLTTLHSFSVPRLNGKYTFFILNVSQFSGTVTLNFVSEQKGDYFHFDDKNFMRPKNSQKIGTIRTIDVNVQANMKYLVPFYLFFETNEFKRNTFEFNECTTIATVDRSTLQPSVDYSDRLRQDIEFHSKIMQNVQSIPDNEEIHFLRTTVLPNVEPVSLTKTLQDFNLQSDCELRVYVGGAKIYYSGNSSSYTDFWNQSFVVYDKKTGERCPELIEELTSKPISQFTTNFPTSFLPIHFRWNSILNVNLNKIGKDKILVYLVSSSSDLQEACPRGFFMISHLLNETETLLFRNMIHADLRETHYAICFRFEYIDDDWKIIPMRKYFKDKNEMNFVLDLMRTNNWAVPEIVGNHGYQIQKINTNEDEFLIDDSKFEEI